MSISKGQYNKEQGREAGENLVYDATTDGHGDLHIWRKNRRTGICRGGKEIEKGEIMDSELRFVFAVPSRISKATLRRSGKENIRPSGTFLWQW